MKPCNQGNIDFFCAIYAIINAVRVAAKSYKRFTFKEICHFYQHMMQYLIDKKYISNVLHKGCEYDLMIELLSVAKKYLKEEYGFVLLHKRPFINTELSVRKVCYAIARFLKRNKNGSCIFRFYNRTVFDHWSVIERQSYIHQLKLFDSYLYPKINIKKCTFDPYKKDDQNHITKEGIVFIKIYKD